MFDMEMEEEKPEMGQEVKVKVSVLKDLMRQLQVVMAKSGSADEVMEEMPAAEEGAEEEMEEGEPMMSEKDVGTPEKKKKVMMMTVASNKPALGKMIEKAAMPMAKAKKVRY